MQPGEWRNFRLPLLVSVRERGCAESSLPKDSVLPLAVIASENVTPIAVFADPETQSQTLGS